MAYSKPLLTDATGELFSLESWLHTARPSRHHVDAMYVRHNILEPTYRACQRSLNPGCPRSRQSSRRWSRLQTPCSSDPLLNIPLNISVDQSCSRPPLLKTVLQQMTALV